MMTKLKYIDRSTDINNATVVFFQKKDPPEFEDLFLAWKVIKNCGTNSSHSFEFPTESYVNVTDSWGNQSPMLLAEPGQQFEVRMAPSGTQLYFMGNTTNSVIKILNNLSEGSIRANIYKADRLLATAACVAPGQTAIFHTNQVLFVGLAAQIDEGGLLESAIISEEITLLDLFGVTSANIVMTGGGVGADARSFNFALEKVLLDNM